MAYISEVYCNLCDLQRNGPLPTPISLVCPMSGADCDGGGNRHQTTIKASKNPKIELLYGGGVKKVVPAVCSVTYSKANEKQARWIVCPRKLFSSAFSNLSTNAFLQEHEKSLLLSAGMPSNKPLGVWAEVYLKDKGSRDGDSFVVNYHFDYVVAPLENLTFQQIASKYSVSSSELIAEARKGGYVKGRVNSGSIVEDVPDLSNILILEVMTASTSGSDTEKGTNISAAFMNAIQGMECPSPGINRRQVWGRMATQLFAKSCLAEYWGGKTIWVIQDQLMNEISQATGLFPSKLQKSTDRPNINIAVMSYQNDDSSQVGFEYLTEWDSGVRIDGAGTVTDILLPASYPPKSILIKSILRRGLSGRIML